MNVCELKIGDQIVRALKFDHNFTKSISIDLFKIWCSTGRWKFMYIGVFCGQEEKGNLLIVLSDTFEFVSEIKLVFI